MKATWNEIHPLIASRSRAVLQYKIAAEKLSGCLSTCFAQLINGVTIEDKRQAQDEVIERAEQVVLELKRSLAEAEKLVAFLNESEQ